MLKKKITIIVITVLLLTLAVSAALGAVNPTQQQRIDELNKKIIELRKQIVDEYVSAGDLTEEEGNRIKGEIDNMYDYMNNYRRPGFFSPRPGIRMPGMMFGGGHPCFGYDPGYMYDYRAK